MRLRLIRNATLKLHYAGHTILIDPDLADRHARPSFTGRSANPTVALPVPLAAIAEGNQLLLVSHLHRDHFDAVESLPKALPVLCQPSDAAQITAHGFATVTPLAKTCQWDTISITRTDGQHGTGAVGQIMGAVSGFVLAAPGEPTIYWAGDTVLCAAVQDAIATFQPDVIVTHACGARWPDGDGVRQLIVMDAAQTIDVCRIAPTSVVVATHMEALDHATVSRADLRAAAHAANIGDAQLLIPADGAELTFDATPRASTAYTARHLAGE